MSKVLNMIIKMRKPGVGIHKYRVYHPHAVISKFWMWFFMVTIPAVSQTQTINVGGAWSDYPTLTSAVASLPIPLNNDVLIVMELGASGMAEPGFKVDGSALGASGHKLKINGIPKDFNSTQNDLTYYIGDEVEYRVSPSGAVQTVFNYGKVARQVHTGLGSDEAKDFEIRDHLGSVATTVDEAGVANGPLIEYDAYGRKELVIVSAAPNLTQSFTGKEYDILDPSDAYSAGLYHFGARMYDPDLALWTSADPVRQFFSPYSYAGNGMNPVNWVDRDGKTLGSNLRFLWQWFMGSGEMNRNYDEKALETKELAASSPIKQLRKKFYDNGAKSILRHEYTSWTAYRETAWKITETEAQVGGFGNGSSLVNNGNGTMTFTIVNDAGTHSFWFHAVEDRLCEDCSMRTIHQTFKWTEPIVMPDQKN